MIAVVLVAGGLLAGLWFTGRLRRLPLDEAGPSAGGDRVLPLLSVVIPARDEAATLPALLGSIARAGGPALEVIVVDDASTDGTGEVATSFGATVLRLDGPPPGWAGKPHACARGADAANGDLLVFLDADVRLLPGSLSRLVAAHTAAGGGLVSVQPYHRVERPYEELSAMFNTVSMIGGAAFAPWPRPRRPVAYGPCLVTSTDDYRAAGGHAAVRAEVVEDIALARAYRRAGLGVDCRVGAGAVEFRMYPGGVRQLAEGWTKNIAAGAGGTDPVGLVAGVWFVAACAAVAVAPIALAVRGARADVGDVVEVVMAWLAVTVVFGWILHRIGSFRRWTAILHPVATFAFVWVFVRSLWATVVRRQVRWRGRDVAVGRSRTD
jgi:4,4'-diaponeurosporenoate glycosyltransferase